MCELIVNDVNKAGKGFFLVGFRFSVCIEAGA